MVLLPQVAKAEDMEVVERKAGEVGTQAVTLILKNNICIEVGSHSLNLCSRITLSAS